MPSYGRLLRRVFSPERVLGGIFTILFAGAIVYGCTMSLQRGGLYFLLLAIPMVGLGLGMIARPFKFICASCNKVAKKRRKTTPFAMRALGQVQAIANSGGAAELDNLLRTAPLPDPKPSPYCVLALYVCECGAAGYLQVQTFKKSDEMISDKVPIEFGAEVGAQEIEMLRLASDARWASTLQHCGFGDPLPPRE